MKTKPTARIAPRPAEHTPELKEARRHRKVGEKYLAPHGWSVGKHAR